MYQRRWFDQRNCFGLCFVAHPILSLPSEFFRFAGIILKYDLMGLTLSFYFYLSSSYPWLLVSKLRSSPGLKETSLDYKYWWHHQELSVHNFADLIPSHGSCSCSFSFFLFFIFCLSSKTACHHLHQYSPPIEEKTWFFISCFPWTLKPPSNLAMLSLFSNLQTATKLWPKQTPQVFSSDFIFNFLFFIILFYMRGRPETYESALIYFKFSQ